MNRKLSIREKWLLTAVPALIVVIVYAFAFYRPQQASLADNTQRLHTLQKDAIPASQVQAKRNELACNQEQIQVVRRELAALEGRPAVLYAGIAQDGGEANLLAKVSRVLLDRSIVVVASSRAPDNESGAAMPADVRETTKRSSTSAKGGSTGVWRLDLVGSFVNVREALDGLAKADGLVVPVGISMEPVGDDETVHRWKLWIWM